MPSLVALIPARSGSSRLPHKNIKLLGGKPLLAWTVEAAIEAGVFGKVLVATDSYEYGCIGEKYGADVILRGASPDDESDIAWLTSLKLLIVLDAFDAFAILRPTSPFRTADTICRAWQHFLDNQPADSLRAVEPSRQHPGKMWVIRQNRLLPLLPFETAVSPWHSSATQTLPRVYSQNASLEIAWSKTVLEGGTIAGTNIVPWEMPGIEGLDVNTLEDWERAEQYFANSAQQIGILARREK